jgi:hypothetical protein
MSPTKIGRIREELEGGPKSARELIEASGTQDKGTLANCLSILRKRGITVERCYRIRRRVA